MKLSDLIIIDLLFNGSNTGYDIVKNIDSGHKTQQVYREIKTLVDDGYITKETVRQVGKPDKQVCHLTEAGVKAADQLSVINPSDFKLTDFKMTNMSYQCVGYDIANDKKTHELYLRVMRMVEKRFIKHIARG